MQRQVEFPELALVKAAKMNVEGIAEAQSALCSTYCGFFILFQTNQSVGGSEETVKLWAWDETLISIVIRAHSVRLKKHSWWLNLPQAGAYYIWVIHCCMAPGSSGYQSLVHKRLTGLHIAAKIVEHSPHHTPTMFLNSNHANHGKNMLSIIKYRRLGVERLFFSKETCSQGINQTAEKPHLVLSINVYISFTKCIDAISLVLQSDSHQGWMTSLYPHH